VGQSRAIIPLATTVAVLIATPVAAQAPESLDNPFGWHCPPGYGTSSRATEPTCKKYDTTGQSATFAATAETLAARGAAEWQAALTKRKPDEQAKQQAARLAQEVERERLQAREAQAEQQAAEAQKRNAQDRLRAAEAKTTRCQISRRNEPNSRRRRTARRRGGTSRH
jgi:hypothetical protein